METRTLSSCLTTKLSRGLRCVSLFSIAVLMYELWKKSGESGPDLVQSCFSTHAAHRMTFSVSDMFFLGEIVLLVSASGGPWVKHAVFVSQYDVIQKVHSRNNRFVYSTLKQSQLHD